VASSAGEIASDGISNTSCERFLQSLLPRFSWCLQPRLPRRSRPRIHQWWLCVDRARSTREPGSVHSGAPPGSVGASFELRGGEVVRTQ